MNVAVIGSGVAGLGAALELSRHGRVTLFEAQARPGGHANTVDVTLDGMQHPVDTGFLVLNERTYPRLLALFEQLNVPLAASDMSFSASLRPAGVEWSGSNLNAVFAQRRNLLSPTFLGMLRDILRFNKQATQLAMAQDKSSASERHTPLGDWLIENRYGPGFRNWYLLPMAAAIWSCPMATMRQFPVGSFARFFHNHGLLQVSNRPQWFTVDGGSRRYVEKIINRIDEVRLATPVLEVSRRDYQRTGKVHVRTANTTQAFDAVVLACHSDQSLNLLSDADNTEATALAAIRYQPNTACLHTDSGLMPKNRTAWSAWNYLADAGSPAADPLSDGEARVSLTYWLNQLQPLPFRTPVFVTLNPLESPRPESVIQSIRYEHPVFDLGTQHAQQQIMQQQGSHGTWFAGAWLGYGFHEDGLMSGQQAAAGILASNRQQWPATVAA